MYRRQAFPWLFLIPLAASAFLLVGCGSSSYEIGGEDGFSLETVPVSFTGESKMGDIGGDPYRYFRYSSEEQALEDKEKVSEDGISIDGDKYDWDGPVHFYYLSKRIVIYVGANAETLKQIQTVFGEQFAGSL
ncbi:hypothetical protein HOF56_04980 [Candidatus Peribacteria bacterium]|nr:hypothetical protein [Candidatus Peribacteria bacterium]MBT4021604.1 hypothetical protein [Candidatus Peribacteria bacterium]MBT4240501.1 hypothetical protein [Candidatus Peribacteria bacterium]MBT4474318.1 hypothetical protein [Candidatus Peribacteria bacterium]